MVVINLILSISFIFQIYNTIINKQKRYMLHMFYYKNQYSKVKTKPQKQYNFFLKRINYTIIIIVIIKIIL